MAKAMSSKSRKAYKAKMKELKKSSGDDEDEPDLDYDAYDEGGFVEFLRPKPQKAGHGEKHEKHKKSHHLAKALGIVAIGVAGYASFRGLMDTEHAAHVAAHHADKLSNVKGVKMQLEGFTRHVTGAAHRVTHGHAKVPTVKKPPMEELSWGEGLAHMGWGLGEAGSEIATGGAVVWLGGLAIGSDGEAIFGGRLRKAYLEQKHHGHLEHSKHLNEVAVAERLASDALLDKNIPDAVRWSQDSKHPLVWNELAAHGHGPSHSTYSTDILVRYMNNIRQRTSGNSASVKKHLHALGMHVDGLDINDDVNRAGEAIVTMAGASDETMVHMARSLLAKPVPRPKINHKTGRPELDDNGNPKQDFDVDGNPMWIENNHSLANVPPNPFDDAGIQRMMDKLKKMHDEARRAPSFGYGVVATQTELSHKANLYANKIMHRIGMAAPTNEAREEYLKGMHLDQYVKIYTPGRKVRVGERNIEITPPEPDYNDLIPSLDTFTGELVIDSRRARNAKDPHGRTIPRVKRDWTAARPLVRRNPATGRDEPVFIITPILDPANPRRQLVVGGVLQFDREPALDYRTAPMILDATTRQPEPITMKVKVPVYKTKAAPPGAPTRYQIRTNDSNPGRLRGELLHLYDPTSPTRAGRERFRLAA